MTSTDPSSTPSSAPSGPSATGASVCGDRPNFVGPTPQEQAWFEAEAATIGFVSSMNVAIAGLVRVIVGLLASEGWHGEGVRSCAHWVAWKAGMAPGRARGLVAIAERIDDLPLCWAAFEDGRLTEDAMVLLARRLPAARDAELARLAPMLMISQLSRLLVKLPDLAGDHDAGEAPEPMPYLRLHTTATGWSRGSFLLPPDAAERLRIGLDHARDAEFQDRTGIDPHPDGTHDPDSPDPEYAHATGDDHDAGDGGDVGCGEGRDGEPGFDVSGDGEPAGCDVGCDAAISDGHADANAGERPAAGPSAGGPDPGAFERPTVEVSAVEALVRLATEGTHALDANHRRAGRPGERAKLILHHDLGPDDTIGPGRLHLGAVVRDPLARYLRCDADVAVVSHRGERLVGIHPASRTVPTALRRAIEDRDQGCVHPLCHQRRHLHIHHLWFWEDGGPTTPDNLVALCPTHHRDLHHGVFSISGNPETGTLAITSSAGIPYRPPRYRAEVRTADPPERQGRSADAPAPPGERGVRAHSPAGPYRPATGERLSTRWLSWN